MLIWALVSAAGYLVLGYWTDRSITIQVVTVYLLLGVLAFRQYLFARAVDVRLLVWIGFGFRCLFLLSIPSLSDDFYRFLWDGEMMANGINPFTNRPSDIPPELRPQFSEEADGLFAFKDYYSVYPPFTQLLFWLSRVVSSEGVMGSLIVLRGLVLGMELGTLMLLTSLVKRWRLKPQLTLLYALNPLVIIELTGNLHLEAVMTFFVLLSLWLLERGRLIPSAVAFGLAVSSKLLPALLIVFLFKRVGVVKTVAFSAIALSVLAIGFIPFGLNSILGVTESLRLYFQTFEFNGSIYYLARELGFWLKGFNPIRHVGPALGLITLIVILVITIRDKGKTISSLPQPFLLALTAFFLLATTVNPWYLTPMIAFTVFSRYRFALLWGFLIPVTYSAFATTQYTEVTWLLWVEYFPVYAVLLFEMTRKTAPAKAFRKFHVKWRANIKVRRIIEHLGKDDVIADIGTGNGGVCHLLKEHGLSVQPFDIGNKSVFDDVRPQILDGQTFPLGDNSVDCALLLTVFHHTPDPEQLLREATRVSRRKVIVMEDVFTNKFQKKLTHWADSVVNWEFANHPHTNKTEEEWQRLFGAMGLRVESKSLHRLFPFRQVTYVLRK